eukprot:TRINITY_DN10792_c0_g2_i2.p1 TRINITY_DN10792_c0_g2~~TRINITY_DN10792_c0_g2_i2.p1  ORF type:complete len:613 (-),score=86.47 TRINITY_DN10792_c0_g2_i2:501-2339(-)
MCQKGDLGNTSSLPGMEPWYFFNLGRHTIVNAGSRRWTPDLETPHIGPWRIPHATTWVPPPYQCAFQEAWLRSDKPIVVIQNKYSTEWGSSPRDFFSTHALYRLFNYFEGHMQVVYIRTTKALFGMSVHDSSTPLELPDFAMIELAFPRVITLDNLVEAASSQMQDRHVIPRPTLVNTLIMGVLAAAAKVVTLQGGDAAMAMYFCQENLMFLNKGVSQMQELRTGDMNWWPWLTTKQSPNYRKCQLQTFMQVDPLLDYVRGLFSKPSVDTFLHTKRCPYCITQQLDGLRDCPCMRFDSEPFEPDAPQRAAMAWLRNRTTISDVCLEDCWPEAGIDSVYVLSIPQRLKHMRNILHQMGARGNIFFATPSSVVAELIDEKKWFVVDRVKANDVMFDFKPASFNKTSRKIACQLSHLSALSHFVKNSHGRLALIMEDDIALNINGLTLAKTVKTLMRNISQHIDSKRPKEPVRLGILSEMSDEGFDIIYLGYCYEPVDSQQYADHYHGVQPLLHPFCRHAYIVTKTGAHKILDTGLPVQSTGDWMHARMVASGQLRAYGPLDGTSMFVQNRRAFGSSLGNQVSSAPPSFRPRERYSDVKLTVEEVVQQLHRLHDQ